MISFSEFAVALRSLDLTLSDAQLYEFMRSVDTNMDNQIDFAEFSDRFEVIFTAAQGSRGESGDDAWARGITQIIGRRFAEQVRSRAPLPALACRA